MNTIKTASFCTCANQYLLAPGCECDICMGTVPEREDFAAGDDELGYGPEYFEALEQVQAEAGLAA
ncbi:MAG: hypothetical protein AAGN35_20190 [Bacteroidota bacterium]